MAKSKRKESVLSQQTRQKAEADAIEAAKAEEVAREAAERAAVEAKEAKRKAVPPKAVKPPKVRRAKFVRGVKEKTVQQKVSVPTPRSTKASGKMMTRNLTETPKDEPRSGPAPKGRRKP